MLFWLGTEAMSPMSELLLHMLSKIEGIRKINEVMAAVRQILIHVNQH
jgi:hypothetical protein